MFLMRAGEYAVLCWSSGVHSLGVLDLSRLVRVGCTKSGSILIVPPLIGKLKLRDNGMRRASVLCSLR